MFYSYATAGLWKVSKIKALGALLGYIVASVVVRDYGNTTNEECKQADVEVQILMVVAIVRM